MTLVHYLCKVFADKLPELLDFSKDLNSLEPASKVQLKYLAEEMQVISKGLEKVVQELSTAENDGPVSENFQKALKEFLCSAEGEAGALASLYSLVVCVKFLVDLVRSRCKSAFFRVKMLML